MPANLPPLPEAIRALIGKLAWSLDEAWIDESRAALELAIRKLIAEREKLLRFAGHALDECRADELGDWDGGNLQETMTNCGLLEPTERVTPCEFETCRCAEDAGHGEEVTCYVLTPLALAARAATEGETTHG